MCRSLSLLLILSVLFLMYHPISGLLISKILGMWRWLVPLPWRRYCFLSFGSICAADIENSKNKPQSSFMKLTSVIIIVSNNILNSFGVRHFLLSHSTNAYGTTASLGNLSVVKFVMPVVSHTAWRFSSWLKCVCISIGLIKNFTSGQAHGLSRGILNIHGLPSSRRSPMKAITFPERFWAKNKSLYFNIEWNIFNSASPFTIPTNTRKFAASTACILNVAHFVDSPPTSACNLSNF